jgi:thioredoxin reductase
MPDISSAIPKIGNDGCQREACRISLADMTDYDVIVIGGGAAGLSAALVLARARRSVLVVDAGHPRNAPAAHLHGYLSRDGLPPAELLAEGRREVLGYGGTIVEATVTDVVGSASSGFTALLADGGRVTARRVLVTTGLRDELPDVPGLGERWGRDVLHCPYCHGYEVRDEPLGVLWNGPESVHYAQLVRQWSHDVVLFAQPEVLTYAQRGELTARAIGVVEGVVTGIAVTDDRLTGVHVDGGSAASGSTAPGSTVPRSAVFVPPRFVPNDDLLARLGCDHDAQGWVVADAAGATSVAGVRVAGNVRNPRAQLITAAGEGSAAAIALNADLVDADVRDAAHAFNHGFVA